MRTAVSLLAFCLVSACARPDFAAFWPHRFDISISAGPQPGYAIKRVIEKLGPITLLGDDGSVCRTSGERFAATQVDDWISCDWTLPSPGSIDVAGL